MYDISRNINTRVLSPYMSNVWDEERNDFEQKNKHLNIRTQYTYKFYKPLEVSVLPVPYLKCSVALELNDAQLGKAKRISLVYFHAKDQNIFRSFEWMFELLDIIDKQLPKDIHKGYDTVYVDLICFEYPFYDQGDVRDCNKSVLSQWDAIVNHQLRCMFDIKLPGERGTFDSFEAYEKETGNVIIYIGASVGCGFLSRQLVLGSPSSFILMAPFTSIKALASKEAKKVFLGGTAVAYLWNNEKHEYFPVLENLKTYIDGDKEALILLSEKDEVCGAFTKDFCSIDKPNISTLRLDFYHNEFGGEEGTHILASKIINIIQNKEHEKNQKELEGAVRGGQTDNQGSDHSE